MKLIIRRPMAKKTEPGRCARQREREREIEKQKLTSRSCKLCTLTQVFYRFIELIEILLFVIEHAILYFIIRAYINSCSTWTYRALFGKTCYRNGSSVVFFSVQICAAQWKCLWPTVRLLEHAYQQHISRNDRAQFNNIYTISASHYLISFIWHYCAAISCFYQK